ncbi:MAG: hypothetical protein IJS56_03115 [Bacilli bacterium]|nr:hypothetical protein [Bacilli bacterium]
MIKYDYLERESNYTDINHFYELMMESIYNLYNENFPNEAVKEKKIRLGAKYLEENKESSRKILKHLIKYPFANQLGARYGFAKEVKINNQTKFFHFFPKITILNNNYYMYNNYLAKDNQKLLKITKINGVDIEIIINTLKKDGYIPIEIVKLIQQKEILSLYGFPGDGYKVTLQDADKTYEFDMEDPNVNINFKIFYKQHKISKLLNKDNFNLDNDNYDENVSYSYDANLRLIRLLHGLASKNSNDSKKIEDIYNKNIELFGRGTNNDKNIDWMFISSFFLFNGEEKNKLADFQYIELGKEIEKSRNEHVRFLDDEKHFDRNQYILKDGEIDISMIFHCVRNSFAHSSYEIINENYVRVYNTNNDFNFLIHKEIVKKFVNIIYNNKTLNDNFPILFGITNKNNKVFNSREKTETLLREAELIEIDSIRYKDIEKAVIDHFNTRISENDIYDFIKAYSQDYSNTLYEMKNKKRLSMIYDKEELYNFLHEKLSDFIDYRLTSRKLRNEEIDNVMSQIDKNRDKFYEHGMINRHEVLTEMVRNATNPSRNITSIINKLLNSKSKSEGNIIDTLNKKTTDYIDYDKVIKATIIAYLNNLLLYNFDKKIDSITMDFNALNYELDLTEIINSKKSRIQQLERENKNIINSKDKLEESIKKLENMIKHCPKEEIVKEKTLKKEEKERELAEFDMNLIGKNNDLIKDLEYEVLQFSSRNLPPMFVIEHLRNSLAHGNVQFLNAMNYEDILNTNIRFLDYDKDENLTFMGTIKFGELLEILNNKEFLKSIYGNDNELTQDEDEQKGLK